MKNYSLAIYGSSLRTNFDKYSDKDMLIVGASYKLLNKLKVKYENYGYSVSTYTYDKLRYLSNSGSLFVEHLKRESSILFDYHKRLETILINHKATVPSNQQIHETLDYFSVFANIPDTNLGYGWFCDCFYVGLRNHLILKSAKQGKYIFSFLHLIRELQVDGEISSMEYACLRELRVVKKNYRDKILNELPDKKYIIQLLAIANKLDLLQKALFLTPDAFNAKSMKLIADVSVGHYLKLRFIEMYYLTTGKSLVDIDRIISNPQFYALKFKDNDFINRILSKIENISGTQQSISAMRVDGIKMSVSASSNQVCLRTTNHFETCLL